MLFCTYCKRDNSNHNANKEGRKMLTATQKEIEAVTSEINYTQTSIANEIAKRTPCEGYMQEKTTYLIKMVMRKAKLHNQYIGELEKEEVELGAPNLVNAIARAQIEKCKGQGFNYLNATRAIQFTLEKVGYIHSTYASECSYTPLDRLRAQWLHTKDSSLDLVAKYRALRVHVQRIEIAKRKASKAL